ncbi:MAG: signal peptide peptidase SppA [Opitutales bacterium]|jgi:protease-4
MRFFWKIVAANIVAMLLTVFVLGMVLFAGGVLIALALQGRHKEPAIQPGSILVFDLNVNITDSPAYADASDLFDQNGSSTISLLEVENAIDAAAKDKNVVGLFLSGSLESDDYGSSYAALREIRQSIAAFKAAGKPVYAYLISPTPKDYYLASTADKIFLNPLGDFSLNGLAAEEIFLGDTLKKYGIGVQVTRVGKYKSATEIFTNSHMSDADREQLTLLLSDIWDQVLSDLAASRNLSVDRLHDLANNPGLYLPADALKDKLVDQLGYFDEVLDALNALAQHDDDLNTFRQISVADYADRLDRRRLEASNSIFAPDSRIAVVYAEGEIVDGEGGPGYVGGDDLARSLRDLRTDDTVKAVVLRVNSPGGSAEASEVIQREVKLLKEAKPVIISFGAVAASGGYWISTPGDYILAEPTTITGSIGVFGLKFNIQDISQQYGLNFDGVKTATFADMDTVSRPWSPEEEALAQTFVDFIYDQFIDKVSTGRGLTPDRVREIAQGRVWSGTQAVKLKLVDDIGGLREAIAKAEDRAGLTGKKWILEQIPEKRTAAEALIEAITTNNQSEPVARVAGAAGAAIQGRDPVAASLRQMQSQWNQLRALNDPQGVYARLPYQLEF